MTAADSLDEMREREIATQTARFTRAITHNCLTNADTALHDMGNALVDHLSQPGVSEHLIRSALSCGPLQAGQMLLDLIGKCIADEAEIEAIKEVDRMEEAAQEFSTDCRIERHVGVREWSRAA